MSLALIKEGTHHYLRFMKSGDTNSPIDIWTREVRFETNGAQQLMQVRQRWDAVNPPPTRQLD